MGYQDNASITVDAVLTKKGREILSRGGRLDINSFTLSDTGVDYTLFNVDHPSGSAFYGEAIENLPMLEASVHSEYGLRNRLISLNKDAIAIPSLTANAPGFSNGLVTFEDADFPAGKVITITLKGAATTAAGDVHFIIDDPTLFNTDARKEKEISALLRPALREEDFNQSTMFSVSQRSSTGDYQFNLTPIVQDVKGREAIIHVVDSVLGAYTTFRVKNNVTKLERDILNPSGIIGG